MFRIGVVSLTLFPELLRFGNERSRRTAWRKAHKRVLTRPLFWVCCIGTTALAINLKLFVMELVPVPYLAELLVWIAYLIMIVGTGGEFVWRSTIRQSLRRQLIEEGVPVCLTCGFDLRGTITTQCPECAASFTPTWSIAQQRVQLSDIDGTGELTGVKRQEGACTARPEVNGGSE